MIKISCPANYTLTIIIVVLCSVSFIKCVPKLNDINFDNYAVENYQAKISAWLDEVNADYLKLNALSAELAWRMSVSADDNGIGGRRLQKLAGKLGTAKQRWYRHVCGETVYSRLLSEEQTRQLYLLCRGPVFDEQDVKKLTELQDELYTTYVTTTVCVPTGKQNESNEDEDSVCLHGEPDLERVMANQTILNNPNLLLWTWVAWHNAVGPAIKKHYPEFVKLLNIGAKRTGYHDIGETWREELEITDLQNVVMELYEEIEPLYRMLHAVVRHRLVQKYGPTVVDPTGPIPAHLLGNMWAQNWSPLVNLLSENWEYDLDNKIKAKNWSAIEMVQKSEDFYMSLGFPPMTKTFWNYSRFKNTNDKNATCHGTAANMFKKNDYRMLMCAELTMDDLYVIHHEMGHIQYYMAYSDILPIFQDGANSAFQESIGDTIFLGVMSPLHLHRLGLISDSELYDRDFDTLLLLYQALSKIPQIPYALMIDRYRWDLFAGKIRPDEYNAAFWDINERLRGIKAPISRSEKYFDAGAKFHVPDNTPYIRYFLSYILQVQFFKGMCEINMYGKLIEENDEDKIPLNFPLHRCDIYGSKKAGKKLLKMMQYGASKHWSELLPIISGTNKISSKPLLEYYSPVTKWLESQINKYQIYVGW